jgi:hypothetical protein
LSVFFSPFIVPVAMFLTVGAVLIFRGPIGRALAERIAGRVPAGGDPHTDEALRTEMEEMRFRLTELEERVDFAERMLARGRDTGALPPGS